MNKGVSLKQYCEENNNKKLLEEWDYEKNIITPNDIGCKSHKKVFWICSKGHSWESIVSNRVRLNRDCPYCSHQKIIKGETDLETINPKLSKEWDYEKNYPIKPSDVFPNTRKQYWWICSKGHSYKTDIKRRNAGVGCPYCSNKKILEGYNDLKTINPNILKEWDYEKNSDLKPTDVSYGSGKKVWWKCKNGHSYLCSIDNKNKGRGCPKCAKALRSSFCEQCVYYYVKKEFSDAVNGYKEIFKNTSMELDIYIPSLKVGIEYDGKVYHSKYDNQIRDQKKYKICKENGITLIRIREMFDKYSLIIVCDRLIEIPNENVCYLNYAINNLMYYLGKIVDVNIDRDRKEIESLLDKRKVNLLDEYPVVAKEWDYKKNKPLIPQNFAPHSNRKVFWICSKCGKGWSASIGDRTRREATNCPFCYMTKRIKVK